ncbi:MAG: hypothetical protein VX663_10395, partial [Pseudomonadota bacterium]|nr:hypothetical protein [Pseudomonadota bacterium]
HAPTSRVDGGELPKQLRFRVYRAVLPSETSDCGAYRHCLRPVLTTPSGKAGEPQRFTDPAPPRAALCYAVTTLFAAGHESAFSNLLFVAQKPEARDTP